MVAFTGNDEGGLIALERWRMAGVGCLVVEGMWGVMWSGSCRVMESSVWFACR